MLIISKGEISHRTIKQYYNASKNPRLTRSYIRERFDEGDIRTQKIYYYR